MEKIGLGKIMDCEAERILNDVEEEIIEEGGKKKKKKKRRE